MISLKDVEMRYLQSSDGIEASMEIVYRDNPLDASDYASWIHISTLARWLYGSSQEFLRAFQSTAKEFSKQEGISHYEIQSMESALSERVSSFRNKLLTIFGTEDKKLTEALLE
jgi:hypothetical protein